MAKKNLSKIAKEAVKSPATSQVKQVVKTEVVSTTPLPMTADDRDKIAKETVANLLSEVNIPQIGNDNVSKVLNEGVNEGISEGVPNDVVGNEEPIDEGVDQEKVWLEEQILALNNEVERLNFELQTRDSGYAQQGLEGYDQNMIGQSTVALYLKIQDMYDNFIRGGGMLVIHPKPFLIELETFFPYLAQYRRRLLDE